MDRIQKIRAERNLNAARWSLVNKNPLGLSSNRYANDSIETPDLMNASTDSMSKVNLLSKEDVSILIN
jgi:hypothetical protein